MVDVSPPCGAGSNALRRLKHSMRAICTKLTKQWARFSLCASQCMRRLSGNLLLGAGAAALISTPAAANVGVPQPPLYDLYGGVGLLEMPSAQFAPDGEFSATVAGLPMMEHYDLGFQALPWLETTFRYSRLDRYLNNNKGGDLYDRSLGIKIRLSKEDDFWPSIAVGAQDILGTGAFGGEYFVASKRVGDFGISAGIGWRGLAGTSPFSNPFGLLFKSFKSTSEDISTGTPLLKDFFHGSKAGLFGGVSWNTPIDGLVLIAEVSGDKYTRERQVGALDYKTPLNFGFSYQVADGFQVGGGYFYGSQFGVRATISMDPLAPEPPARLGTPPPQSHIRSSEESNNAVLSLLQNKTHFYDNWPGQKLGAQQTQILPAGIKQASLADVLFEDATLKKLAVRNVETFGNSLLVDTAAHLGKTSCASIQQLLGAADTQGIDEVALSSRGSPDIQMCRLTARRTQVAARPVQYASNTIDHLDSVAISDDGEGTADENANSTNDDSDTLDKKIIRAADDQKITIVAINVTMHQIDVAFTNGAYRTDAEATGRLLRVLMAEAPNEIEKFRIVSTAGGLPTIGTTFSRSDIERALNLYGSAQDILPLSKIAAVSEHDSLFTDHTVTEYPSFGYSIAPGYRQSLFDPQEPFRFEVYADLRGSVDITEHWNVSAGLEYNIYNTFNITRQSNSLLPHVRSDFALYYKHGLNGIAYLQTSYFDKLTPNLYGLVRAGLLESMYAGVGGELLWQPDNKRWALAGALYAVQQRGFDRRFDMRNYKIITGHVGVYYNSPFENLDFAMFAGRYLAGDYGATFQVTRRFDSGVEIGVYATLTNVPFHTFGEGSFDKGFIIRIPVDSLLPVNTQSVMRLDFTPLTRDGGQMVDSEFSIYSALQRSSEGELLTHWDQVLRP